MASAQLCGCLGKVARRHSGVVACCTTTIRDTIPLSSWPCTEVVSNGSASDAQVLNNSELKETIDKGMLGLPDPEP
ncbi:hypothetical protein DPMN_167116 [Dreissena polymorpha]|uniref:Uncharacterized protein n=1 Tax=Dreissena polymorpha TaxID=45954 RepID=A0A9D4EY63_DREPO|nr:hypothetical protein DPMN_167116 [Dreissena polymorpha]